MKTALITFWRYMLIVRPYDAEHLDSNETHQRALEEHNCYHCNGEHWRGAFNKKMRLSTWPCTILNPFFQINSCFNLYGLPNHISQIELYN